MLWLYAQMWTSLLGAALLGLLFGYILFRGARASANEADDTGYYDWERDHIDRRTPTTTDNGADDDGADINLETLTADADRIPSNTRDQAEPSKDNLYTDQKSLVSAAVGTSDSAASSRQERQKIYDADFDGDKEARDLDKITLAAPPSTHEAPRDEPILKTIERIRPPLYTTPTHGDADDLKRIKGIGPTLESTLNEIGIFYFDQIAAWDENEVAWIDNQIDFPGRVTRENWVNQARTFSRSKSEATISHTPHYEEQSDTNTSTSPKQPDYEEVEPHSDAPASPPESGRRSDEKDVSVTDYDPDFPMSALDRLRAR